MPPARHLRSTLWTWAAGLVLGSVGVATGCGSPPPDRVPGPELLDQFAPAMVGTVATDAAGFDTEELRLAAGEAIELTNDDDGALRVQGRVGDDLRYDTGEMRAGEMMVLAFLEPGQVIFTVVDGTRSVTDDEGGEPGAGDRSTSLTVSVVGAGPGG